MRNHLRADVPCCGTSFRGAARPENLMPKLQLVRVKSVVHDRYRLDKAVPIQADSQSRGGTSGVGALSRLSRYPGTGSL